MSNRAPIEIRVACYWTNRCNSLANSAHNEGKYFDVITWRRCLDRAIEETEAAIQAYRPSLFVEDPAPDDREHSIYVLGAQCELSRARFDAEGPHKVGSVMTDPPNHAYIYECLLKAKTDLLGSVGTEQHYNFAFQWCWRRRWNFEGKKWRHFDPEFMPDPFAEEAA